MVLKGTGRIIICESFAILLYHWALIIGPKIETQGKMGVQHHVKERPKMGGDSKWLFEKRNCLLTATSMLLVRGMNGKVEYGNRLVQLLRTTSIKAKSSWMELRCLSTESSGDFRNRR